MRTNAITAKDLRAIQHDIQTTVRPGWFEGPPPNFGTAGAGTIKADVWAHAIAWDVPVSLVKLWGQIEEHGNDPNDQLHRKLLEATMQLAMAIRWGTSQKTSAKHADEYQKYMHSYLQSLRDLFPEARLMPSHHNALHIGEFLLRYGPVWGWWMFAFERLIGSLEKINTNYKTGEHICACQ